MENFNINRFFKILLNSKLYLAFVLVIFIAIGYFYSFYYVTPMYSSSATVMLVQNDNSSVEQNQDSITGADITLNQNLLSTYTKIAKSDRVLEQVISNLGLDISIKDLSSNISVQSINSTEVFKISVNNKEPSLAASIANELVSVFSNEVQSLYNMNNIYLMDVAEISKSPFNINHTKDIAVFGVAGLMISFGLVVIIYLFDNTIKSEQDIEEYTDLSVLSTIPVFQNKNSNELIVNEQPKSSIAECFKTFRTNVMFSIQNKSLHTILVTSGHMSEGKSFVSSNLAVTFAQSGKRVVLVDTDMRKGRVHKIFNLYNETGLSNCLSKIGTDGNLVNINEFIQKTNIPNLHVMTSGIVPPNPSELLSSPNMKKFLEALNSQYDIVICDGTPCMLVSDSIILSKIVDTTIIVTANKVTKLDTVQKIKKSIEIVGGNIGGAVINKMTISSKSYNNNYYYGNHNETNSSMNFNENIIDNLLENNLYINQNEIIEDISNEDSIIFLDKETDYSKNFDRLSNMISDNSKEILELRNSYKNAMNTTLEAISSNNTTDIIMNEFAKIQNSYKDSFNKQNTMINDLTDTVSNISNSNVMLELENMKNTYMDSINQQNNSIASLEDKISSLANNDSSNIILAELENIKNNYKDSFENQDKYIASLEDKISSLANNDNSNIILAELENIKNNYKDSFENQDKYIASLADKISNIPYNDNSSIFKEVKSIYKQLETINSRFDYLERKAKNNEELIKKLTKATSSSTTYTRNKILDVTNLNHKVISIQDYLENKYNNIVNNTSNSIISENNNNLDNQISIVNNLIDKAESTTNIATINNNNTYTNKQFVVDYDRVKNKQKRSLFSFKTKYVEPDYYDKEEIAIVSQILA